MGWWAGHTIKHDGPFFRVDTRQVGRTLQRISKIKWEIGAKSFIKLTIFYEGK